MCSAEISKEFELLPTQFSFGWLAQNSHPASILANFHFSQLKDVQSLEEMSPRAPWEAQVPPLLLSPTQCSFPAEFLRASHDAFSHTLQLSPLKPRLDFLPHHETSWSLWCGTQWNLLVLLLIPWSLLYLPAACCLCLKLNSCSCCSSSALFQSTVSGCKHKKTSSARGQQFLVVGCKEEA